MTALIVIGSVLLFFVLLSLIPVGGEIRYGPEPEVSLTVLGIRIRLIPAKKSKRKKTKKKEPASEKKKTKKKPKSGKKTKITAYIPLALDFLSGFKRKLLVRELTLDAVFGGKDPADAALNYGRAWALIGNTAPTLQRAFRIRKLHMDAVYDAEAESITLRAVLHLTLTIGQVFSLAFQALIQFLKIKMQDKSEKAVQKHEQSDQ